VSRFDEFLRKVYFFADLGGEEIALIAEACCEATYADGDIVFREGERGSRFCIVMDGRVEIWKDFEARDSDPGDLLAVGGPGHLFGEMALVDDLPRSATVRARGATRLLCMEREDFHRIIHANSSVAISLFKSLSLMVRKSNDSFVDSLHARNRDLETAYRELKNAQDELLRAERLSTIGKLASLILHDIRNPISVVRGYAEMMLNHPEDHERIVRNAGRIISEADRLNRIAGELLDYSRGDIRLNLQIVDLGQLVGEVCEEFEEKLRARGIRIEARAAYHGPVLLDRERMLRVFHNLVENARKAMPQGGTLSITVEQQESGYRFVVSDTGVGMSREVKERIFEPFFSASSGGGTGLGMSIVKSIVEAHEGSVIVESERGKGTEFRIVMPGYA
jgi:signal transduction histidine kinase